MGLLSYGYKALKAGKGKTIKSVKPFAKTGGKTVEQVKQGAAKSKYKAAKFNLNETFKKTDKALEKLKNTTKAREGKMGGGMMGRQMYKKGGKSFPDLTGDGKVTKKDILRGRGVPGFAVGGRSTGKKIKQSKTGSAQIAESLNPKTKSAIKRITGSNEYKKADYKGKTKMLGGKFFTAKEMKK